MNIYVPNSINNVLFPSIPLTMEDCETRLNSFIEMIDYGILLDFGKNSSEIAKLYTETASDKYRIIQAGSIMPDYDRYLLESEEKVKNKKS